MQGGRGTVKPPVGIAFEGDVGHRIDALLALAMLNGLVAKGEARRIALGVSRPSLPAAQLADVVAGFYSGRPVAAPGSGGVGGNPEGMIGMPETGTPDANPPLAAALRKTAADGTRVYSSAITRLLDTAENAVLIRNMLLAQNDGNATIVVAGPATNLRALVGLYGARPQILTKVARLVVAAGAFGGSQPDPSIAADVAAARAVFANWPGPIVVAGQEVGEALRYPGASIESDFAWAPNHPVVDAYRLAQSMPYDAPASALAALLYAAHPDRNDFRLSEPGTVSVQNDGQTTFAASAAGRHRYLIVEPTARERVLTAYRQLVSAPPAPRGVRGRGAAPAAVAPPAQPNAPAPVAATPKPPAAPPPASPTTPVAPGANRPAP